MFYQHLAGSSVDADDVEAHRQFLPDFLEIQKRDAPQSLLFAPVNRLKRLAKGP